MSQFRNSELHLSRRWLKGPLIVPGTGATQLRLALIAPRLTQGVRLHHKKVVQRLLHALANNPGHIRLEFILIHLDDGDFPFILFNDIFYSADLPGKWCGTYSQPVRWATPIFKCAKLSVRYPQHE